MDWLAERTECGARLFLVFVFARACPSLVLRLFMLFLAAVLVRFQCPGVFRLYFIEKETSSFET